MPAAPGSAWSEQEKLALYQSIIRGFKTPVPWKVVAVPEGRTQKSAKHVYDKLMKEGVSGGVRMWNPEGVEGGDGEAGIEPPVPKPRKRAAPSNGNGMARAPKRGTAKTAPKVKKEGKAGGKCTAQSKLLGIEDDDDDDEEVMDGIVKHEEDEITVAGDDEEGEEGEESHVAKKFKVEA